MKVQQKQQKAKKTEKIISAKEKSMLEAAAAAKYKQL